MSIGYSPTRQDKPINVMKTILAKWSSYEIINPMTWHSVTPLGLTWTVMLNGPAWDKEYAHPEVRTTKGKDLDKMPEPDLINHLSIFRSLVKGYLEYNE